MTAGRTFFIAFILLAIALAVSACGGSSAPEPGGPTLAPESALPDFVKNAPPTVKEAYRYAIANPNIVSQFPCYCGCGAMGHKNNLECYIKETRADGSIEFDNHAFG